MKPLLLLLAVWVYLAVSARLEVQGPDASISFGGDTTLSRTGPQTLTSSGDIKLNNGAISIIDSLEGYARLIEESYPTRQYYDYRSAWEMAGNTTGWSIGVRILPFPYEAGCGMVMYVPLRKGNYSMVNTFYCGTDRGSGVASFNGVQVLQFDQWRSSVNDCVWTTDVTVPVSGPNLFHMEVTGKNPSATGYQLFVVSLSFKPR